MSNNLSGFAPLSASQRKRAQRSSLDAVARSKTRGNGGKRHSLFDRGEFVAIDGEGFSESELQTFVVGDNSTVYTGREHYYSLLSASDGSEIYAPKGRLGAKECLDFILDIKRNNQKAIIVCFGGSYDATQILAHDLTREQITRLMRGDPLTQPRGSRPYLDMRLGDHDYRIEYRARKSLSIWRWPAGADKYERGDGGKTKLSPCDRATMWDVIGFFQEPFSSVMHKWIPNDPDYQFIVNMKEARRIFNRALIETIRDYNRAELRCLVNVMNLLREAVIKLDLKLSRWDGAGAIAGAMMSHNGVRDFKGSAPASVFTAARGAYSGGHIEVCKIGYAKQPIYHYDINSAYPHHFRDLPALAGGYWSHGSGASAAPIPTGFTLVHIEYHYKTGLPFYPLFFRNADGSIIYPARGRGWYWYPDYEVAKMFALKFGSHSFRVLEYWHFTPSDSQLKPFAWIETYYSRRQYLVESSRLSGIPSGEEKILKLGYNACYGKTAQQVGARLDVDGNLIEPTYFQLEWAGYVTSGCRAQLMRAAIQKPNAIIAFATDGLFSLEPLDLDCPISKTLGAWEMQLHSGITTVMPGVYWLHETNSPPAQYSRGFSKSYMSGVDKVHMGWKRKFTSLPINITRLIGLGSSITSDSFWKMRGMFVESERSLALNGDNSKRYPLMLYKESPHLGLVNTHPRDHDAGLDAPLAELNSALYSIDWIENKISLEDIDIETARYA